MNGEFSMAVVQANNLLEDQSQIESGSLSLLETGPYGTFIGVYDGHGGPEASNYVYDNLFQHLKSKNSNRDEELFVIMIVGLGYKIEMSSCSSE